MDLAGNNLTSGLVPHSWSFSTISVNSLIVTPLVVNITSDRTVVLIAQAYDWQNNPINEIAYTWSVSNDLGTISPQGAQTVTFKASFNTGICYVNVTAGGKSASAFVTIKSDEPGEVETEDSQLEDMAWISFLWLLIITACLVILVAILWKKGVKTEGEPRSVGSVSSEENVDEKLKKPQESTESEPEEPPPPPDSPLPPPP